MKKLILISLDGVNWEMIQPTIDKGLLPNLQKLIELGTSSTLQSHGYLSSGSTWPSIHTGRHPGEHGIFFSHRQLKSGTYDIVKKQAADIPFPAFWQQTSRNGIKTIAFDLPKAPLIEDFNGLVLNSWGEEAPWYSPSYPLNLKQRVHEKFGKHPLQEFYHRPMKSLAGWKMLKKQLVGSIKTRFEVLDFLMNECEDWELVVMAVNEMHLGGHLFWHLIHPQSREDLNFHKEVGDILEKMYTEVDQAIGTLIEGNPDTSLLILSNNGMKASNQPTQILDAILKKLGYMYGEIVQEKKLSPKSFHFIQELEHHIPIRLVRTLKKVIPKDFWDKWTRKILHSDKEWMKSQAFPVPNDVSGAIRINLQGREPNGIVAPEDYQKVCKQIEDDLKEITINGSKIKAVREIIHVQEEFPGLMVNELPDLLILWNLDEKIREVESKKMDKIKVKEDKRTGAHTDQGLYIWYQPGMNIKTKNPDIIQDLSIYPTVLEYFGIGYMKMEPNLKSEKALLKEMGNDIKNHGREGK